MSKILYDYFVTPFISNKELVAIYYSILPIRLSSKYKIYHNSIRCIVDSGSDFNLFPAEIGEVVGISIKNGEKAAHKGIGDFKITAYRHTVTIYLEDYKFHTEVNFSYEHKVPILGRYGFFDRFKKIVFNESKLLLELHY